MPDPTQLQAGILRHVISIQAPSTTRDAAGQMNTNWATILTTRAAIMSTASQTFKFSFQNNQEASNATDLITIRYPFNGSSPVEITPDMRVVFGTQLYTIQAVDDVLRRHRVLHLAVMGIDTASI